MLKGARFRATGFRDSGRYWEARYARGDDSGAGSYGHLAAFKAEVINGLVADRGIGSVIEYGCGDGNQLRLARYPSYVGLDVSASAIDRCLTSFRDDRTKSFFVVDPDRFRDNAGVFSADLAMSLDVIYHLVEDRRFEQHLRSLFASGRRLVLVYSSDTDGDHATAHVRHRRFTTWVERNVHGWRLAEVIPNRYPTAAVGVARGSDADFYLYEPC